MGLKLEVNQECQMVRAAPYPFEYLNVKKIEPSHFIYSGKFEERPSAGSLARESVKAFAYGINSAKLAEEISSSSKG